MSVSNPCQTVVVLGASAKPQRYSYKALMRLKAQGHKVIPVHPKLASIEGLPVYARLSDIHEKVDTLTMYVGPERSQTMHDDIITLAPRRVIFNPGTESASLEQRLQQANIAYIKDCTLVMLQSNQFDF